MNEEPTAALKRFYRYEEGRPWLVWFRCLLCGVPTLVVWVVGSEIGFLPDPPLVSQIQETSGISTTIGGIALAMAVGLVVYTLICAALWPFDRSGNGHSG